MKVFYIKDISNSIIFILYKNILGHLYLIFTQILDVKFEVFLVKNSK